MGEFDIDDIVSFLRAYSREHIRGALKVLSLEWRSDKKEGERRAEESRKEGKWSDLSEIGL